MTTTPPVPRTQRERREIARQARRHGYYRRGELTGYVLCPLCRAEVEGYQAIVPGGVGRRITMTAALDEAMLTHLADDCGQD